MAVCHVLLVWCACMIYLFYVNVSCIHSATIWQPVWLRSHWKFVQNRDRHEASNRGRSEVGDMDLFLQCTNGTRKDPINCLQCSKLLPVCSARACLVAGNNAPILQLSVEIRLFYVLSFLLPSDSAYVLQRHFICQLFIKIWLPASEKRVIIQNRGVWSAANLLYACITHLLETKWSLQLNTTSIFVHLEISFCRMVYNIFLYNFTQWEEVLGNKRKLFIHVRKQVQSWEHEVEVVKHLMLLTKSKKPKHIGGI